MLEEGKVFNLNKKTAPNQITLEVGNNTPTDSKIINKDEFTSFVDLYKGVIDMKCLQDYGTLEDKDLWNDCAKELYLKSRDYLPMQQNHKPEELEKKTESISRNVPDSNITVIHTGLTDNKSYEILESVIGQMSDGIWENSPSMEKFWQHISVDRDGSEVVLRVDTDSYDSGFKDKSIEDINKYMANKLKQVVKIAIDDGMCQGSWNRNDESVVEYLGYNDTITVRDAYRVYDQLMGRKPRITTESKEDINKKLNLVNKDEYKEIKELPEQYEDNLNKIISEYFQGLNYTITRYNYNDDYIAVIKTDDQVIYLNYRNDRVFANKFPGFKDFEQNSINLENIQALSDQIFNIDNPYITELLKTESKDNLQIRKYPNEEEFKGVWGLYDIKQNKFLQKGPKYLMKAALNDFNKKSNKLESNSNDYKSGDVVDILSSYGKWLNSSDRIKYVIDRPATKEEIEGIWDIDTPCYIVKTIGKTDDTKFLNGTSKEPITRLRPTIYKSKEHKMNEAAIDDNATILEALVDFLNDNNITADNIVKNKDLVEKYLSDNKLGISAYIPTIYKVVKDDYGNIGRIIFYRSKNEWGFNTSSIVVENNKDGTDIDTIEESLQEEEITPANIKEKALEILPKEDVDVKDSDLYIKVSDKSKKLINKLQFKNNGLLTTFRSPIDNEMWYDIPFANLDDYITSKTESNNNTYYYDIHIVEDDATGMGYSVFIKTTKHYDEDLDADAIVDESIKQNKLDADEADYCDYVSEISEQEYKDAAPHIEVEENKLQENNTDLEYKYMLLDRLKQDCEYFLGNGNGNEKQLWAGSIDDQINEMRKIWNNLDEKPEWLTMEDINNYEKLMKDKKASKEKKTESVPDLQTIQDIEEYINNIKDEHTKSILHHILEDEKSKENPSIGYLTMAIRKVLDIEQERNKEKKKEESAISDYTLSEIKKVIDSIGDDFNLKISNADMDVETKTLSIDREDLISIYNTLGGNKDELTESRPDKDAARSRMFSNSRKKLNMPDKFTSLDEIVSYLEKCEDEIDVVNVNTQVATFSRQLHNDMLNFAGKFIEENGYLNPYYDKDGNLQEGSFKKFKQEMIDFVKNYKLPPKIQEDKCKTEAKEYNLSKDLYQNEANKRIHTRLEFLDVYLEKLENALKHYDTDNIDLNRYRIRSNVAYLIPALNIKGGTEGLVKYLKDTDFDFENRFKETADLLLNKTLFENKHNSIRKTESVDYDSLIVVNNLGNTQFVKARKDKEDKEFRRSGAGIISSDDPNSLKNKHDLAIRAQTCIYKLEDLQSQLDTMNSESEYDVNNINKVLADYGFDAYVTDLFRNNLGNLDTVDSCSNFITLILYKLQQIKENDLNK